MKRYFDIRNKVFNLLLSFLGSLSFCVLLIRNYRILVSLLLFLPTFSFSQIDVLNNGLQISNSNDSVIIYGNVIHQGDGLIANAGSFYITGNWKNDNPLGNVFTIGSDGWVHLDGGTQTIGGNTITHFNNLELAGSGGVKQLNYVDTEVEDTLALNDRELAAGDKTVFVLSADAGVVTQSSGFVSSTNDGGLSRNTLSTNKYFFPVGSSFGGPYRPVDITPNSASANTFKVRMANVDASNENFYRNLKEGSLTEINPNFYHRISRTNGNSPADISIYFDNIVDGNFDKIAQWRNTPQWESIGTVEATTNYGLSGLKGLAFDNFSTTPFALTSEVISSVYVPNVFSPNGDGFNDILMVRGKAVAEIQFIVYDRWGEKVFETNDINTGWDGTYKGEPMNLAVFVYMLTGKYKNGKVIDEKGNFTLLR